MVDRRIVLQAVAWALASAFLATASQSAAKFLSTRMGPAELALFRAIAGVGLVFLLTRGAVGWTQARNPSWYAIRILAGALALGSLMVAAGMLPIGVTFLIFLTRVLMVPLFAAMLLREPISARTALACAVGFAGAVLAMWPSLSAGGTTSGGPGAGAVAALLAAVFSALSQVAVRRLVAGGENPEGLVVAINSIGSTALIGGAMLVAAMVWNAVPPALAWVTPPGIDIPVLLVLGCASAGAQWAAAIAFRLRPIGSVVPLDFTAIPLGAAMGYLLFGEVPRGIEYAGAGLIVAAAWVVVTGYRQAAQK